MTELLTSVERELQESIFAVIAKPEGKFRAATLKLFLTKSP